MRSFSRIGLFLWVLLLSFHVWGESPPPPDASASPKPALQFPSSPSSPLPLLILSSDLNLPDDVRPEVIKAFEDALFQYPNLSVFTWEAISAHIAWERGRKSLDCELPEDCLAETMTRFSIRHTVKLSISPSADAGFLVRLTFSDGDDGRVFEETSPAATYIPSTLERLIPDLIGVPSTVEESDGVLFISSLPLNAEVRQGERIVGHTPCSLARPAGESLTLTTSYNDLKPATSSFRIVEGKVIRWEADLTLRYGDVLVDSTPPGATIRLDGQRMGTTPEVLRGISVGDHLVSISMPPFPEADYTIQVQPDSLVRVQHTFSPEKGVLKIECTNCEEGKEVEIYLNGEKAANGFLRIETDAGTYQVQIVCPGRETFKSDVEVVAGEEMVVKPELKTGLSLRPGQVIESRPDYRPGGFALALGLMAVGFGAFLEYRAEEAYENADKSDDASYSKNERESGLVSRATGIVLMGVGGAATITGIVFLARPPHKDVAITPVVTNNGAAVNFSVRF